MSAYRGLTIEESAKKLAVLMNIDEEAARAKLRRALMALMKWN